MLHFFLFGIFFFAAYFKKVDTERVKDYGGEEERMTRRNISGPDLKPGHHIYTAHYAPQPTDTSCFINKKMEGSNDVCIILRVIWGFAASQQTQTLLLLLLLLCFLLFKQQITQNMLSEETDVWSQVCAESSCSASFSFSCRLGQVSQ